MSRMVKIQSIAQAYQYKPVLTDKDLIVSRAGALSCQEEIQDSREKLSPFRHAIAFLRGTIAANGSPILVAAQSVSVFSVGVGDTSESSGGGASELTTADTNAIKGGGLVKQRGRFVTVGMGVNPLDCWHAAADADIAAARSYPAWLRDRDSQYGDTLIRSAAPATTIEIFNGPDAACEFDLGPLDLWNSTAGSSRSPIGLGGQAGQFWYISMPEVSGGHNSGAELDATVTVQRPFSVPNDARSPTVAGVVAIPFRFVLLGFPICPMGKAAAKMRQLEEELAEVRKATGLPKKPKRPGEPKIIEVSEDDEDEDEDDA